LKKAGSIKKCLCSRNNKEEKLINKLLSIDSNMSGGKYVTGCFVGLMGIIIPPTATIICASQGSGMEALIGCMAATALADGIIGGIIGYNINKEAGAAGGAFVGAMAGLFETQFLWNEFSPSSSANLMEFYKTSWSAYAREYIAPKIVELEEKISTGLKAFREFSAGIEQPFLPSAFLYGSFSPTLV
jgi:hypothetical protein